MVGKDKSRMAARKEKSFAKGLSLMGFTRDGNVSVVDTRNGKIVRIRPFHFDWKYDRKKFNPWKMEARGQVLGTGHENTATSFQPGL